MKKTIGAKTLVFPTPVWIIGSYDEKKKPNIMSVAWGGICCSKPPSIAISLRKATYSYHCIMDHKAFTVNVPSVEFVEEADYAGIASGRDVNKFDVTGLTPVASEIVDAPYIKEFPLILECQVRHAFEIGLHTQFVGEIMDVKAEEDVLGKNGMPDMSKVKPLLYAPTDGSYYASGEYVGKAYEVGNKFKE